MMTQVSRQSKLEIPKNDQIVQTDDTLWQEFLSQQNHRWDQKEDILGSLTSPMHPLSHQQTLINTLIEQLQAE